MSTGAHVCQAAVLFALLNVAVPVPVHFLEVKHAQLGMVKLRCRFTTPYDFNTLYKALARSNTHTTHALGLVENQIFGGGGS